MEDSANQQRFFFLFFINVVPSTEETSFWPLSMVYISVIILHILHNISTIYESNYSVVIQTLRFSFLFWKIVPCWDLNLGPPGTKQIAYQCANQKSYIFLQWLYWIETAYKFWKLFKLYSLFLNFKLRIILAISSRGGWVGSGVWNNLRVWVQFPCVPGRM